jgi:hypothetical protein
MHDRWLRNRVSRASSHPYSRAEVTADCSVYTANVTKRVWLAIEDDCWSI